LVLTESTGEFDVTTRNAVTEKEIVLQWLLKSYQLFGLNKYSL